MIDVYSRRLRYLVSKTSKATAIVALLRHCIIDWGVPETLKIDNGKDYKSAHVTRVLDGLEVNRVYCTPFQGQEKPHIERSFHTFLHVITSYSIHYTKLYDDQKAAHIHLILFISGNSLQILPHFAKVGVVRQPIGPIMHSGHAAKATMITGGKELLHFPWPQSRTLAHGKNGRTTSGLGMEFAQMIDGIPMFRGP